MKLKDFNEINRFLHVYILKSANSKSMENRKEFGQGHFLDREP